MLLVWVWNTSILCYIMKSRPNHCLIAVCHFFSLLLKYTWVKFTFPLECFHATGCPGFFDQLLARSDRGWIQPAAQGETDFILFLIDARPPDISRALLIEFAVTSFFVLFIFSVFLVPFLSQNSLECLPTPSCVILLWNCKGFDMCLFSCTLEIESCLSLQQWAFLNAILWSFSCSLRRSQKSLL